MKRTLLLVAIVSLFLSACTKEETVNTSFFDKYELRANYGGLAGFTEKYPAGNGRILLFKSDSTFVKYEAGAVAASGTYHIKFTGTDNGARYGTILFSTTDYSDAFRIKGDTITIGTTIADGVAADYVRLK